MMNWQSTISSNFEQETYLNHYGLNDPWKAQYSHHPFFFLSLFVKKSLVDFEKVEKGLSFVKMIWEIFVKILV